VRSDVSSVSWRAPLLVIVAAVAVLSLVLAGGLAGAATADAAALQQNATNETDSPEHVRPDDAGDDDQDATAGWLENRLAGMLADGAIQLDEGEYELADQYVGEAYQERLGQYVDVEGEQSEAFEQAGESQRELATLLEEYQETLDAYETARDNGNETRTRQLARELAELSRQIESEGVALERSFVVLENTTDTNYSDATRSVNETVVRIRTDTERITEETFVATNLTAAAERERIAADRPLAIEGRLTSENGTPIGNATIAVLDPAGATTVTTDAEGRYAVTHRPRLLRANASALTVVFRPDAASPYARAEANVSVDVEPVAAELSIEPIDGPVAFGERASTTATVSVNGTPLSGVPLRATLDGNSSSAPTATNGTVTLTPTVDAAVRAGERSIRVAPTFQDRAVTLSPTSGSVTVTETATTLSASATANATGRIAISGRLVADGTPVPNAAIEIAVDGAPATTLRTDADGRYEGSVQAPGDADVVSVRASFDGSNSNLQGAAATANATVVAAGTDDGGLFGGIGRAGLLAALGVLVLLVGGGAWAWWQRDDAEPESTDAPAPEPEEPTPSGPSPDDVLGEARDRLGSDPTGATTLAYGAARSSVADAVPGGDRRTHREFLADCAADGFEAETVEALRTLTDRYEAAVYDPTGIDEAGASEALDAADRVAASDR